jgi:hypothetical protein
MRSLKPIVFTFLTCLAIVIVYCEFLLYYHTLCTVSKDLFTLDLCADYSFLVVSLAEVEKTNGSHSPAGQSDVGRRYSYVGATSRPLAGPVAS